MSNSFYDTYEPGQQYKIGNTTFTAQEPVYIGKIGKYVVGKDELGRTVYDDGTAGYTQYDSFGNEYKEKPAPKKDSKLFGLF
jgi:hypothetical protein